MKRKEELISLVKSYQETDNQDIFKMMSAELGEISILDKSKMLGREFTIGKKSNPLVDNSSSGGSLGLSTIQTQTLLEKYNLVNQLENLNELNAEILKSGKMALFFYKTKNEMASNSTISHSTSNYKILKVQCRRMIQLVNFHLSAHVFDLKEEQDQIAAGN